MRLVIAIAVAAAFAAPALAQDAELLGSPSAEPRLKPARVQAGQEVTLSADFTSSLTGGVARSTSAGGCDNGRVRAVIVDGRRRSVGSGTLQRFRSAKRFRRAVSRAGS